MNLTDNEKLAILTLIVGGWVSCACFCLTFSFTEKYWLRKEEPQMEKAIEFNHPEHIDELDLEVSNKRIEVNLNKLDL